MFFWEESHFDSRVSFLLLMRKNFLVFVCIMCSCLSQTHSRVLIVEEKVFFAYLSPDIVMMSRTNPFHLCLVQSVSDDGGKTCCSSAPSRTKAKEVFLLM